MNQNSTKRVGERKGFWSGVMLVALFAFTAFYMAGWAWVKALSLSPLIVGILLGMVYANTLRSHLPESWKSGVTFCSKKVLRGAIILYGFRLTFQHIIQVGTAAIVVDLIVVTSVMLLGLLLNRWLGLSRNLSLLVSAGSAVCGAAAVLGTEAVLKDDKKPHETAVAVTTVVIFGTISMFLYPALYRAGLFDLTPHQMGIYTGSTLHEVAHVVGAGNAMNSTEIASTAIIVKMTRVLLLVPLLLIIAFAGRSKANATTSDQKGKSKITIPWFAFGFLITIVINSILPIPAFVTSAINSFTDFALTMAMVALGMGTTVESFRKAGPKPFLMAFLLFIWLFVAGYLMAKYLVPLL